MSKPGPEAKIERDTNRVAAKHGWVVRKLITEGNKGAPDRMYMRKGRIVFIEYKAPGEPPSPKQKIEHKRYRQNGFEVVVADNVKDALNALAI